MGAKKASDFDEVDFLTTTKIANRVSKSTETIRREILAGRLRAKTFRGDYAITPEAFEEWKAKYFKDL